MRARLSIDYVSNAVCDPNCKSEVVDLNLQCEMHAGETFWFVRDGYEWMGRVSRVHHLFDGDLVSHKKLAAGAVLTEYANHLPMFTLIAEAVRKTKT